jgi:hypothetical protein
MMSLGGDGSDEALWYPLSFPEELDNTQPTYLEFIFMLGDVDVNEDWFCAGLLNDAGEWMGPDLGGYGSASPLCVTGSTKEGIEEGRPYRYRSYHLTAAEKRDLAGQTGYLVFYVVGDGSSPHLIANVDDVVLALDLADVELSATPAFGPPGTEFLIAGHNFVPHNAADFYIDDQFFGTAYADTKGDVLATIDTTGASAGNYTLLVTDRGTSPLRTDSLTLQIREGSPAALQVSPASGQAGTKFAFTGSNFRPNDNNVKVVINGDSVGTVSSNDQGQLAFSLTTSGNTQPGAYRTTATDSSGSSATASFQVTQAPSGAATLTVSPTRGAPGTRFTFEGSGFKAYARVALSIDATPVGQTMADGSGRFEVALVSASDAAPGDYVMKAADGSKQATARFTITGGGTTTPQTGNGLYLTLVWTDPPAQAGSTATLINNLNLRVKAPNGTTYYGNGGTSADRKNNVETLRLEKPVAGTYAIYVEAQWMNASYGSQPYALVGTAGQSYGGQPGSVLAGGELYLPILIK